MLFDIDSNRSKYDLLEMGMVINFTKHEMMVVKTDFEACIYFFRIFLFTTHKIILKKLSTRK